MRPSRRARALRRAWELFCLDPPGSGWRPWTGLPIQQPAFQLQARSAGGEFDLFTETVDHEVWQFRRDDRITRPLSEVSVVSVSGIPIVRPEVQLLYMAKSADPKNQHDFVMARPRLNDDEVSWLARALVTTLPEHRWLQELQRR